MSDSASGEELCQVALEAAFRRGMEICESKAEKERATSRLFGLTDSSGEPDVNCDAALEEGFNEETCSSFRGSRQLALCMVWNDNPITGSALMDEFDGNFEKAVSAANAIVDVKCGDLSESDTSVDVSSLLA